MNPPKSITTNCFKSLRAACVYYQPICESYDAAVELVKRKYSNGEIEIGKPKIRTGERLELENGRFKIVCV